jgi:murein DD-endopeptidase MepM/ murein hydrolase activator NlpD
LKLQVTSDTVPRMHSVPAYRRSERRAPRAARRARRRAVLTLVGLALLVILFLAAFRPGSRPAIGVGVPASASRLLPAGPPTALIIATHGQLHIQLPVNERNVTAIGYHGAGDDALPLDPIGRQANEGLFSRFFHRIFGSGGGGVAYYQLGGGGGPSTGSLNVGAAPGTDVYAPVDGTIVGLSDYVLDGQSYGSVIDIQPSDEPSVVLSVTHLRADPSLQVGSTVSSRTSRIGSVVDFSGVERLALSRYTQDAGNHVAISVRSATTVPLR